MSLARIIERVMSLNVTEDLLKDKKANAKIHAEITAINQLMGEYVDGTLKTLFNDDGKHAAAEILEPVLINQLPENKVVQQALYDKIELIDNLTKRIQQAGCPYFGMLHTVAYKTLNPQFITHGSAIKFFCELNIEACLAAMEERLIKENLITDQDALSATMKDNEADQAVLISTMDKFAQINTHFRGVLNQYHTFNALKKILKNGGIPAFRDAFENSLQNFSPIEIQGMDLHLVNDLVDDSDRLFLVDLNRNCEVFLAAVQDEINQYLQCENLYQTFEEFCAQPSLLNQQDADEATQRTRLINNYYKDRNKKMSELSDRDPKFKDLCNQHKEIVKLQSKLFDTKFNAVERRANFDAHLVQNIDILRTGNENAAMVFLKSVAVVFAALVTAPLLGVGGWLAYQGLFGTPGREFVKRTREREKRHDRLLADPEMRVGFVGGGSPRGR